MHVRVLQRAGGESCGEACLGSPSTGVAVEPRVGEADACCTGLAAGGMEGLEGDVPDLFAAAVAGYDIGDPMTVVSPNNVKEPRSALDFDGIAHQRDVHGGRYVTPDLSLDEEKFSEQVFPIEGASGG